MTDVRLTATNPEDSSVVPVACNSKGEFLVATPVIEQFDNDVTITGNLNAGTSDVPGDSTINGVEFNNTKGIVSYPGPNSDEWIWLIKNDGNVRFRAKEALGSGSICFNQSYAAIIVFNGEGEVVYSLNYQGESRASSFILQLETDNPANFRSIGEGEETGSEYIGPELDVYKALIALKNEVQLLEEKLKMTPSSGWEVWDGSDEN